MTTIVAVKAGGRVAIAADTLVSWSGDTSDTIGTKLVSVGDGFVGFAGTQVLQNLFEAYLAARLETVPIDRRTVFFLFLDFWKWSKSEAHLTNDNPSGNGGCTAEVDGSFLVVAPGGIFSVGSDLSVVEHRYYWATGAGENYALGALRVLWKHDGDADDLAHEGVEVASHFNLGTGGDIDVRFMDAQG